MSDPKHWELTGGEHAGWGRRWAGMVRGRRGRLTRAHWKEKGTEEQTKEKITHLMGNSSHFFFFLLSKIRSFLVSSDRRRQRGKAQRLDASLGSGGRSQSCERIKPTRYIPFPLRGFLPTQSTYLISTLDKKQGCLLTSSRGSASSTLAGYASDLS